MEKRIIWKTDKGGVAVFVPAPKLTMPLDEVAKQVVPPIITREPTGEMSTDDDGNEYELTKTVTTDRPYQIVDVTEIPSDRTFRDAWELA